MSDLIYKYCPPNQFTLDNLNAQSIFCRHPHEFNDPFEFWATVHKGLPEFQKDDERFRAAVAAWGIPETAIEDLLTDRADLMDYLGGLADDAPPMDIIFERARIACFSSDPRNLLMWSHYADGLRGCCFGFNAENLVTESETTFIADVLYLNSPPAIDTLVYSITEDAFNYAIDHGYEKYEGEVFRKQLNAMMSLALSSKPAEWQYEKERRLIVHTKRDDKGSYLHVHESSALQCVIIGERMNDKFRASLREIIERLGVPVMTLKAKRSPSTYALTIQETVL